MSAFFGARSRVDAAERRRQSVPGEGFASQSLEGFDVFSARPFNDISGENGGRTVLVPSGRFEPVAHELLVVARRAAAGSVLIDGPEARAIGGEDLVDQDDAIVEQAELKLGVGEDDAARAREVSGLGVDVEAQIAQGGGSFETDDLDHALERDIFVMSGRGFAGGGKNRFGKWIAFTEASRKFESAHGLTGLIFLPARPREISAHHALDRKDASLRDDHAATIEFFKIGLRRKRHIAGMHAEQVVRHAEVAKPKPTELCEDSPLIRDATRQNPVEGTDAVGRDEEQSIAKFIDIAHLAAQWDSAGDRTLEQSSCRS